MKIQNTESKKAIPNKESIKDHNIDNKTLFPRKGNHK